MNFSEIVSLKLLEIFIKLFSIKSCKLHLRKSSIIPLTLNKSPQGVKQPVGFHYGCNFSNCIFSVFDKMITNSLYYTFPCEVKKSAGNFVLFFCCVYPLLILRD